ncbi:ankyrin repeat-containing domain protein [Multifurca ochricompacta]|uniref:Ankyrin repeat-containing domain protein n=1 Tax=Multifurca ochricompacta TaxID=376703 RepID=A0AAD4LWL0_9AGAM|nr:ankyrin repeat-containing domain protein [Multifurca ochricompacta]
MTSETPPKPLATPLYYASQFGLIHTVRWLIYRFPMVIGKFAGYYGTPLIAASAKGHSDIATELILRGERPRLECSDGRTALYSASENGHLEIVKVLLAQYPPLDIFFMRQYSPLGQALCKGHLEIAGLLLQHGARVDLQNSLGETVLHQASKGGYDPASIKMLLMYNANTRSKDASGKTPLEIARESGHEEIARLLWEHDA